MSIIRARRGCKPETADLAIFDRGQSWRTADFEFVYVLVNNAMPGICKIGKTKHFPEIRAAQLSASSGCPLPFHILCYAQVRVAMRVESKLHWCLDDFRVSPNREFFRLEDDFWRALSYQLRKYSFLLYWSEAAEILSGGVVLDDMPTASIGFSACGTPLR